MNASLPSRTLLATLLWVGLGLSLWSALPEANIGFVRITRQHGLSQNTVTCILQDRNGFIWVGTENGLNRFDGYGFSVFLHDLEDPSSLSHGYIMALHEDRDGILWIGTFNGGLNRFDPASGVFQCFRRIPGRGDSLSGDIVSVIREDRKGGLWLGTDTGLNHLDRKTGRITRYLHAPGQADSISHDHIHDICEDRDGGLWIGTYGGGLNRLDRRTGTAIRYRHDPADPASLSSDFISTVYEDKEGSLWIGTENGLNHFDRRTGRCTRYSSRPAKGDGLLHDQVTGILEDRNGRLWIATRTGLNCLDRRSGMSIRYLHDPFDPMSLGGSQVRALCEDRSGILWIGTYEDGISQYNPNRKRFSHFRSLPGRSDSLGSGFVWSFGEDAEKNLWLGTQNGLDLLDREQNTFRHFGSPGDSGRAGERIIRCLSADRSGNLWLGTDGGGLKRFDRRNDRSVAFRNDPGDSRSLSHDRIRAILEDRNGTLWIGTYGGGLNRKDGNSDWFTRFRFDENDPDSLSDDMVRALLEDRGGDLWIGTYGGGLNRYDRANRRFVHYRHDPANGSSLSNDYIFCLHEDREANIWIGTWGGGLNKLNRRSGTFSRYTRTDGLASNEIYGILEDESGNLWLTTNEGLSRFSPRLRQFRNFAVSDGLQSREFNGGAYYKSRDGQMFFGGANGFNAFYPQNIFENLYIPPVRITSFKVMNREVKLEQPIWKMSEIELSPRDTLFSFEFAALDYSAPEQNQYAYKLEGLTDEWIHTAARHRQASFSRLPPGRYVFRVKGSNSDGVWSEEQASLVIRVLPPWWRTWWFLSLLTTLAGVLFFQWNRTHIKRMAAKIRTEAAMDQMFAKYNISPREKEIAILLLKGKTNKEISERLFIEISTVKIHIHHIFRKLGIQNRAQLLRLFKNVKV